MKSAARGIIEYVVAANMFKRTPVAGDLYLSKSGKSLLSVMRVVAMTVNGRAMWYRLVGMRVKATEQPADAVPMPWPRKPRPSRAAEAPKRREGPFPTRRSEADQNRKRLVALRHDEEDHRVKTGSATVAEWQDPDDVNPRRREARIIRGMKSTDIIDILVDKGTLGKHQARSAQRFRKEYELGEEGLRASRGLGEVRGGFEPGQGPSEMRVLHLRVWQETAFIVGKSAMPLMLHVLIHGRSTASYAAKHKIGRHLPAGMLLNSINRLREHYGEIDKEKEKQKQAEAERAERMEAAAT